MFKRASIPSSIIPLFLVLILSSCSSSYNSAREKTKGVAFETAVTTLSKKTQLTKEDLKIISDLPRSKRELILKARGWKEIAIKGESYFDNALNYQYNVPRANTKNYKHRKDNISSRKKLKELKRACMKKEECVPWVEFKNMERWQPSERDTEAFSMMLEIRQLRDNDRNDHHNSVDFKHLLQYGDPVLVHDGWSIQGYWRHAGIGYLQKPNIREKGIYCTKLYPYIISSYHGIGVVKQQPEYFNNYDEGVLLRVNAYYTRCKEAQEYAFSKIGYPYNDNWLNKWPTNKFYCSQLIWAAYFWTNPRIDIDATPNNNWVSPDDIYNDGDTYVVQHSY